MLQPIAIENDAIRAQVWPGYGGKIASIVDKADGFELLFNYPVELPTASHYDMRYGSGWYAGWDECFPAIAAGTYPAHPYDGIPIPDHGELWGLPTVAVPTRDGITTVWHGLRFGYRLTRKLQLRGAGLTAEYRLVNLAPFEFRFVWAAHALMSWADDVEIDLGEGTACRFSHDAERNESGEPFAWPRLHGNDLSRPSTLPPRKGWKTFSAEPATRPAIVRYPSRGRQVAIRTMAADPGAPVYWGIWINTGGWAGHRHLAVEPTTGRYDDLARSVHDSSAGVIAPLAQLTWNVTWTLGPIPPA